MIKNKWLALMSKPMIHESTRYIVLEVLATHNSLSLQTRTNLCVPRSQSNRDPLQCVPYNLCALWGHSFTYNSSLPNITLCGDQSARGIKEVGTGNVDTG